MRIGFRQRNSGGRAPVTYLLKRWRKWTTSLPLYYRTRIPRYRSGTNKITLFIFQKFKVLPRDLIPLHFKYPFEFSS